MKQLTEIKTIIDAQRDEIESLKDRLILAQSEALSAIQQNEPKPEPRDIGHENVVSFVTRKSGELQVSPGIVWGLIMDLIAKNPNHFGTDADACPDPVECPRDIRIGDLVRLPNGDEVKVYDIKTFGVGGQPIYIFRQKHDVYFADDLVSVAD
jgi:hypothetical protein